MVEVGAPDVPLQRQVGEFAFADDLDKTCGFKLFQVVGKGSCAHILAFLQIAAGKEFATARGNCLQYLVAPGFCESAGDLRKLALAELPFLRLCHD